MPALSTYGTSARLRTTCLCPCCARLWTLSFSSTSPSPSVSFPFASRTITLPTRRSSICIAPPQAPGFRVSRRLCCQDADLHQQPCEIVNPALVDDVAIVEREQEHDRDPERLA